MSEPTATYDAPACDFNLQGRPGDTVFVLWPVSESARDWATEFLPEEALRLGVDGYVVEHRYIGEIIDGIRRDGLTVRLDS